MKNPKWDSVSQWVTDTDSGGNGELKGVDCVLSGKHRDCPNSTGHYVTLEL